MEDPQLMAIIEQIAESLLPPCSPYCKDYPRRVVQGSEHGIRSHCAQQRSLVQEIYFRYLAEAVDDPENAGHQKMFRTLADEQAKKRRKQLFEHYTEFRANQAWKSDKQRGVIVDPTDLTEPNRINEWSKGNTLHPTLLADMSVPQKICRLSIVDDLRLNSENEIQTVSRCIAELASVYLQSGQDLQIVLRSQISNFLHKSYGQHWLAHIREHYQEVHKPVPKYKSFRTIWFQKLRYHFHYLDRLSPVAAVPFVNFSVSGDHVYLLDQKLHLAHHCKNPECRDFFLHLQWEMPSVVTYRWQSQNDIDCDPRHAEQVLRECLDELKRIDDGEQNEGDEHV